MRRRGQAALLTLRGIALSGIPQTLSDSLIVLRAVRGPRLTSPDSGDGFQVRPEWFGVDTVISEVIDQLDRAVSGGPGQIRLSQLVREVEGPHDRRVVGDLEGNEV